MKRKILSLALVLTMLLSMVATMPLTATAATENLVDSIAPYVKTYYTEVFPTSGAKSITMGGKDYKNALKFPGSGVHSASFNLEGSYTSLTGLVGRIGTSNYGQVLNVYGDGELLFSTEVKDGLPKAFSVNVTGVVDLKIEGASESIMIDIGVAQLTVSTGATDIVNPNYKDNLIDSYPPYNVSYYSEVFPTTGAKFITMGGKEYRNALRFDGNGTFSVSFDISGGGYTTLSGLLGRTDTANHGATLNFYSDGKSLKSIDIPTGLPKTFSVDVSGVTDLKIEGVNGSILNVVCIAELVLGTGATPTPTPDPSPSPDPSDPSPSPAPSANTIDSLLGVWKGSYGASQGETGLTLTVYKDGADYKATFEFYNLPGKSNAKEGSYRMNVSFDAATGKYSLKAYEWIVRASGYVFVDLSGTISGDVFSGSSAGGGGTTFNVTRDSLGSADSWARPGIQEAIGKNFVPADIQGGYTAVITRAEFCTMAVRWVEYALGMDIASVLELYGIPERAGHTFSDTTDFFILAAYKLGITGGEVAPTNTAPGKFNPGGQFNRQQAAVMILNTCKAIGADVSNPGVSDFTDMNLADSWAHPGIHFVRNNGIMNGKTAAPPTFAPKAPFTRQESIITFNNIKPDALPKPGGGGGSSGQSGYSGIVKQMSAVNRDAKDSPSHFSARAISETRIADGFGMDGDYGGYAVVFELENISGKTVTADIGAVIYFDNGGYSATMVSFNESFSPGQKKQFTHEIADYEVSPSLHLVIQYFNVK